MSRVSLAVPVSLDGIARELVRRGAREEPHGRSSLFAHLQGTRAVLEAWLQPQHVVAAGLAHSIYSTDAFEPQIFATGERAVAAALIGERAERLTYLFGALEREVIFAMAFARTIERESEYWFEDRFTSEGLWVAGETLGELVILHLANEAEQRSGSEGQPEFWLAPVSALAASIRDVAARVPPIFDQCRAVLSAAGECKLLAAYEAGWTGGSLDDVLGPQFGTRVPVGEPWLLAGFAALARGDRDETRARARIGQDLLLVWNAAWDKRLTLRQWREIAGFLLEASELPAERFDHVSARIAAPNAARLVRPEVLYKMLENIGAVRARELPATVMAGALPSRFAAYVTGFANNRGGRALMTSYPGLASKPWHDPAVFPIVAALEADAEAIAAEILAAGTAGFHAESESVVRHGAWKVVILFERGRKREEVCARLPRTTAIIEAHRTVRSLAGLAYVSRLAAGSSVALHMGPTNMRVRCHLGVAVPPGCGIEVDGETREWTQGRCLVFDDSFRHRVWNAGSSERIVLIIDLWHPDLTDAEIALLEGMQRYGTAAGESLMQYWAKNDELRIAQMETP